jgi:hypothetical protein
VAIESGWADLVDSQPCPACGAQGRFGKHARYQKYHFAQRIDIQRVICHACETTHAMIPRFSVPDTSLGTEEAERSLLARAAGDSRRVAGRPLVEQGMEGRSGRRLEEMLDTAVSRAKAIWPQAAELSLQGLAWVSAVCGRAEHPILDFNRWALEQRVNAICFCRCSILFFRFCDVAERGPHKPASPAEGRVPPIVAITSSLPGGSP